MATYKTVSWDINKTLKLTGYKHVSPVYYVNMTLTSSKITAKFVPESNSYGAYFGYNIGIKVWSGSRTGESSATIYGKKQWNWGNTSSYTHKSSDDTSITIDISGMSLPIYIQPLCTGCDHASHSTYHTYVGSGCSSFIYEIKSAHNHISAPSAPTIVKTSGTTITVRADSGCQVGEVKNGSVSSWKTLDDNNQYIFTGYSKGTSHTFKTRKKCRCGTYYYSGTTTTAKTWNITNKTASKQGYFYKATCKATHTPGTPGTEGPSDTKIHYDLYKVTYNSSGKVASRTAVYTGSNGKSASSGTAVTFTGLTQNTNYVCVAYSTDIKNKSGAYDNKVEMKIKTATVFSVQDTSVSKSDTSGFNVNTQVKHNDALNVECTIAVYKYGTTTLEETTTVSLPHDSSVSTLFNTLSFGTKYTIKCTYTGTSKDTKDINEIYTITKTLVTSTKNADIDIENIRKSARAVKFDVRTNVDIQAHINDDTNSNRYTFYKCIKIFNDNNEEVSYDEILSNMGYNDTKWSEYTVIPNTDFSSSNSGDSADVYKAKDLSYGIADDNNSGPGLLYGRRYIIYIKCVDNNSIPITESECTSTFSTWNFYLDFDILETTQNSIKCRIDVRRYDGNYTDSDEISTNSKYTHIDNPSINPIANNLYQNNSLSSYVYNATTNPNGVLNDITTESTNPEYEYRTTDINISKTKERIYENNNCYRHIFTFSNLIYYCDHKVIVGITDGFNVITTEQYIQTEFPYIRVYTNGFNGTIVNEIIDEDDEGNTTTTIEEKEVEVSAGWHKAIPYVFINDKWIPAVPLIYDKNKLWKIPNGDD